jgi:hypothetical protein
MKIQNKFCWNLCISLDKIFICALLHYIKFQEVKYLINYLPQYMHVHTLNLGLHIHIILFGFYKIVHFCFLLKLIVLL